MWKWYRVFIAFLPDGEGDFVCKEEIICCYRSFIRRAV